MIHHNPKHNPTNTPGSSNLQGNPHNNSHNGGPVTLYDLRHGTKIASDVAEHSVRVLLNVENWTAWRLKVYFFLTFCRRLHFPFIFSDIAK